MFTPLEHRVVSLVTQGKKTREIAVICHTTGGVIRNYLKRIFEKTGTRSRLQLALWYTKHQFEVRTAPVSDSGRLLFRI